jgi:hypothetical protein
MADFALSEDGVGYDADFSRKANGKRDLRIVRKRKATAQRLQMRYRTFLGECRYNRIAGVPWTQVVFAKGVSGNAVRAVLEQVAVTTPGVLRLIDLNLSHNPETRVSEGTASVMGDDSDKPINVPLEIRF